MLKVSVIAFLVGMSSSYAGFEQDKKQAISALTKLQYHVQKSFSGVHPDNSYPPFVETRQKSDSCRAKAITKNDFQSLFSGMSAGKPSVELESDCLRSENPHGDVRSFNCLQFGRFQAKAEVFITEYMNVGKYFAIDKKFELLDKELSANLFLLSFPIDAINSHCMENLGTFNVNLGHSFSLLLDKFRAYKKTLPELITAVKELKK